MCAFIGNDKVGVARSKEPYPTGTHLEIFTDMRISIWALCFFISLVILESCSSYSEMLKPGDSLVIGTTYGQLQDSGTVVVSDVAISFAERPNVISILRHGNHIVYFDGFLNYKSDGDIEMYQSEFTGEIDGHFLSFHPQWITFPVVSKRPVATIYSSVPDSSGSVSLYDTAFYAGTDTMTIDSKPYPAIKILVRGDAIGNNSKLIGVATYYWYCSKLGYFVRELLSNALPTSAIDMTVLRIVRH